MADVARISPKTYRELFLSPSDKALPDVSDYFGNSAGKFIDFMKLIGKVINARLYSNRTGTWLKTQDEGRIKGMEPCVSVPLDPGDPSNAFQFGAKKSKKRSKKTKKSKKRSKKTKKSKKRSKKTKKSKKRSKKTKKSKKRSRK